MTAFARIMSRLRRAGAREDGAVIIIVAACMTMFLAAGAMAIDLGAGRQAQTKAQSAADAAAEAAASAIVQGSSATTAATTIAQDNGIASSNIQVVYPYDGSNTEVEVLIRGDVGTSVANALGHKTLSVMASAVAAVNTTTQVSSGTSTNTVTQTVTNTSTGTVTSSSCATAGSGCLAIYASGTSCGGDSGDSSDPVVFGGGVTVTGGAWSNGSINLGGGGSTFGALTYANGCSISPYGTGNPPDYKQNSNTFKSGYPVAASPLSTWPINYATDFPACTGSGCTGPCADANNSGSASGDTSCSTSQRTPSYCTQASTRTSWSIDTYTPPYTLITGQIYCAVGTGAPSTPSTWNGALTVSGGSSSMHSTFVARSISVGGGSTLASCGYHLPTYSASTCSSPVAPVTPDYPLFYAINGMINESSGGNGLTGDWFVPNGSISVGGGTSFVGFLEAQTVNLSSGGIQGDGPSDSGTQIGSTSTTTSTSTSLSTSTSTTVTTTTNTSTNGSKLVG